MFLRIAFFLILSISLTGCSFENDHSLTRDNSLKNNITEVLNKDDFPRLEKEDSLNNLINNIQRDSTRIKMVLKISYHYFIANDSVYFRKWHAMGKSLSLKIQDSSQLARSYWLHGNFHYRRRVLDSAFINYRKASTIFKKIGSYNRAGLLLNNIAIIQRNIGDLTGSEITTFQALDLYEHVKGEKNLYPLYNNLGIVYNELREFEKSILYHKSAYSSLAEGTEINLRRASTLNNLGVVHQRKGDLQKAIESYHQALAKDSIKYLNPRLYAMLLDNKSYSRMLAGDTSGVHAVFQEALRIRDSIGHLDGAVINKIHLSEYSALAGDTIKAFNLAQQANSLAKKTQNNRDILASYLLMSKFDKTASESHLKNYINLSDSLQRRERAIRNKFTKIKFETDHVTAENEKLYEQRKFLVGLSLGLALLGISGFVIKTQRTRNRELILKQEKQEANEKILRLLLNRQTLTEEGRQTERKRISEELHDGILAKLFGTRMSLDSLNTAVDPASIELRKKYLKELKEISRELRDLSHQLNSSLLTAETSYVGIIEEVLKQYGSSAPFSYHLEVDDNIDWERIPGSVKLHLYRIVQEAVKNIHVHSRAKKVLISFKKQGGTLTLKIKDDGMGFDSEDKSYRGLGIKNMKSRVKAMEGNFRYLSEEGEGTTIIIQLTQL